MTALRDRDALLRQLVRAEWKRMYPTELGSKENDRPLRVLGSMKSKGSPSIRTVVQRKFAVKAGIADEPEAVSTSKKRRTRRRGVSDVAREESTSSDEPIDAEPRGDRRRTRGSYKLEKKRKNQIPDPRPEIDAQEAQEIVKDYLARPKGAKRKQKQSKESDESDDDD